MGRKGPRGWLLARMAAVVVAAALAVALSPVSGVAAGTSLGTVDLQHQLLTWSGGGFSGLVSPPLPAPCAYNCDQRSFTLNLPDSAWAASDSGVLVSIHYPSWSDSLALYVFDPSGNLVGSSYGLDTNGQGVFLSHPTSANSPPSFTS